MKLISQKHAKYGDKEYSKHWIVIPNKMIEKLGWKAGNELVAEIKGDKLIIEKEDD
jgi:bifunctional DNA-binding transcriptional regulator/antitoxin component of YhaV-PrlF toxin-antitoxin module